MNKWFLKPVIIVIIFILLISPSYVIAQNRAGINIGTKFEEASRAISVVGSGGWLVVITGGTGDCTIIQDMVQKTQGANVNLIIRGHLGNYLTPPDALGWAATLGSINTNNKLFFMPWNEPNQEGTADYGRPEDVIAYTAALRSALDESGAAGKVFYLSPMVNQSHGNFSSYITELGKGSFFNMFDGIAMNLYDFGEQVCGEPLCASNPHLNPARFGEILSEMGASGKPAFGVESGTAGDNFYWKMPPNRSSPLYRFTEKFLQIAHPTMFALPAYDLAGEVGHTWDLFTPPDVTNLLSSEPGGGTTPANFDQAKFSAWLQNLLDSGDLTPCGNGCGYAPKENPGLCTATGSLTSYALGRTTLTPCVLINEKGSYGYEQSSPIMIKETVTYNSDEKGTQYQGTEDRCFNVSWDGELTFVEDTFELPWAYYLNEYFVGPIDVHRVPPEILDPLQLKTRDALYLAGPLYKLTPQRVQDHLKNQFLQETVSRIEQSRAIGEPKTAYISADLSEVFSIGPWTLEEIFHQHNVYSIREDYYKCMENKTFEDCQYILSKVDEMTDAVWTLVPMFGEEMTEGQVMLSAVDMSFDPNPVISKNPEVYRLNKITKFIRDTIQPETGIEPVTIKEGVYGDTGGTWEKTGVNTICYDATDPNVKEGDKKESSYLLNQNLSSNNYEAEATFNFGSLRTHMSIHFRASIDEEIKNNAPRWQDFAGFKSYSMALVPTQDRLITKLWKTVPPYFLLNDPILLEQKEFYEAGGRTSYKVKIRVIDSHIQTFVDLNGNGTIDEVSEKVFDLYDSDHEAGDIGFSIYNPLENRHCFTNLKVTYVSGQEQATNKQTITFENPFSKLKNQTAAFFDKLFPKKLKQILASINPLQPPDNLLAQAGQVPPCCFYYYGNSWGDCSCMATNSCRGEHGCCPMHWFWGICGYTDCDCSKRPNCDPNAQCPGTYFGGEPIPGTPGDCATPDSVPYYPDPEAFYDTENYTPDMCFVDNTVDVSGSRMVKNECPYKKEEYQDPVTGEISIIEVPDTCTKEYVSAINVLNVTPWLSSIFKQSLKITSGLFRNWNITTLIDEDSNTNPFRSIPAKDQVTYTYIQTAGDPGGTSINTELADYGPWDLLFEHLGGVVRAQEWLTGKVLNPLTGKNIPTSYSRPTLPEPPTLPPPPTPSQEPTWPPGQRTPPPPTQIAPPSSVNTALCSKPYATVVEDEVSRNYVFGNYTGSLLRTDSNAHSDRPYLATIVTWPDRNFRFVFSQEAGANNPFFEFSNKGGLRFQFFEGAYGSGELYNRFGRLTQNSQVKILQNDPLIIQWEYWDVNMDTGQRVNHAVEYYTFYPCGLVQREMKFLEVLAPNGYSFEPIEVILMNTVGRRWYQQIKPSGEWYHTLTLQDVYSDQVREHFAKPTDLNKSETMEQGISLYAVENLQGKIFNLHHTQGEVFLIYGNKSGLPNEIILDVGQSWGHPCFDHGIIGWINSEWHKCDATSFAIYPNATPIIGINHQPQNDSGGQHNFTLMGILDTGVGQNMEDLKNIAKDWLDNSNFGL